MEKKYIIDDVKFNVPEEEREKFIQTIKKVKECLIKNDALPNKFELFHDIDKNNNVFTLFMGFEDDASYDIWEEKYNKIEEIKEIGKPIIKFTKGYNYSEKITI